MSKPISLVKHFALPRKTKIFECADHVINISKKLEIFYDKGQFYDIVVIAGVDGVKVPAHRIVLLASSDYFLAIFRSTLNETKVDEIEVKNVGGETLELILGFMYTASIELRGETVERVLKAADFLQMNTLRGACCDFLGEGLAAYNCLGVALFAEQHSCTTLYKKSITFVYSHFGEVFDEEESLELTLEQLVRFVFNKRAVDIPRLIVLRCIVEWVEYDEENREQFFCNLLSHVRITSLQPNAIMECTKSICKTIECYKLIHRWLEWHLLPETRSDISTDPAGLKKINNKLAFVSETANFQIRTYSPELDKWSNEECPRPSKTREFYSMAVVNRKLIVAGGQIGGYDTNTVECLDLQTMQWTELPPMEFARLSPGMTEFNGHLYVVGGKIDGQWSKSVEVFDFSLRTWLYSEPMSCELTHIRVAVLRNLLYVVGDDGESESYDSVTGQWTTRDCLEESSYYGFVAVKGYLFWANHFREVKRYDPTNKSCKTIESLNLNHLSIKCAYNDLLIFCHLHKTGNSFSRLIKSYNPETGEIKSLAPLLVGVSTSSSRFLTI